jgi:hypothetical protein
VCRGDLGGDHVPVVQTPLLTLSAVVGGHPGPQHIGDRRRPARGRRVLWMKFRLWIDPLLRNDSAQAVGAENVEHRRHIRSPAQTMSAVDIDHLAGDPAGGVAEQENRRIRDVVDLAKPRQRRAGRVVVTDLGR